MSWWYYWLLVPAVLVGLGAALVYLSSLTMRPYRRLEDGMRQLAEERGAHFREGRSGCLLAPAWAVSVTPQFSVVEARGNVKAVLIYDDERMGSAVIVNLVCAARKADPGGPVYSLRPRDLLDPIRRFLGSEEVEFDDAAFTGQYVVTASDGAAVREVLHASRRKALRNTLAGARLECDGEVVVLQLPSEVVGDLWKADAVLDLVLDLARGDVAGAQGETIGTREGGDGTGDV